MEGRFVEYTAHALLVMSERGIEKEWVLRVLENPRKVEGDPLDPDLTHAMAPIPEFGGRVLRVIYNHSVSPWRVVTAFIDRAMKEKI
ncbi:MAG: DUF4258 domain-containing protein [Candidatus Deferrimicrobiaceae bacterium]